MSFPRLRRPSHATIVSYLALFVAFGGAGAYAADTVFSSDIADGEVKTPDIAANAITRGKVIDGTLRAADFDDGAVTEPKLADGAVTNAKIADGAVTDTKLADGAVTTTKLGADAVTYDKVAPNTLGADDIGFSAVGQSEIATDGVGAAEVAADSIDSDEIVDHTLGEAEVASSVLGRGWLAFNDATLSLDGTGQPQPKPFSDVLKLNLPAGTYMIFAKAEVEMPGAWPHVPCKLVAGSDFDTERVGTVGGDFTYPDHFPVSLMVAHTFASAGTVQLQCQPSAGYHIPVRQRKIMAMRVGVLTKVSGGN